MTIVNGYGPTPCDVLLAGEAPGLEESKRGRPFVGKSGVEQDNYLARHNLTSAQWYKTNVVKEYREGNPDPTLEQIEQWTPVLVDEVSRVRPKIIVAVGRFAMRWFLGESAELEDCHGLPHKGGAFDESREGRALGAVVIPVHHPAFGLHNPEAKTVINWDYTQVAGLVKMMKRGRLDEVEYRVDEYDGSECYLDVTGSELAEYLDTEQPTVIGLDTEGIPSNPWSVQVSTQPGTAYVLRVSRDDFGVGIKAVQRIVDSGCLVVTHDAGTPAGCMYDTIMCRAMGLELCDAKMFNTMYASYLLRIESKGLKTLMYRWCGMRSEDYQAVLGDVGRSKQVEYLKGVVSREWRKPETRAVKSNDGLWKTYTPKGVTAFTQAIIRDVESGKVNKDGEVTDPYKRWQGLDTVLRKQVESVLGTIPVATLDDVPIEKAIYYAGRDADATLRLRAPLTNQMRAAMGERADTLFETGMRVLPMFEEMQRVGMPASRSKFEELNAYVEGEMDRLQAIVSSRYYGGKPFNPNSSPHVASLLRRRGLQPEKRTKTGKVSTSKRSIEHLRAQDEAVDMVIQWRENAKVHSTYCQPILEIADREGESGEDLFTVRCKLKPVTVTTRRLSSEDPSLLNQPTRTELGRMVRSCYVTPPGEVFGAWDFSGQEMRVAAHVSEDRLLCKLFIEGRDPHTEAAARIFGIPVDQVDKFNHRLPAKTGNFGILYGLSGLGLQDLFRMFGLDWPLDDCQNLIDEILKSVYPDMADCIKRVQSEAAKTGKVQDLFGMIRYLPLALIDKNLEDKAKSHYKNCRCQFCVEYREKKKQAAEAGRQAFSHVIQGTAQGMMQSSMAWLRPYLRSMQLAGLNIRLALQVHDELIVRMDEGLWSTVDPLVMEGFIKHCGLELRVPVEADGHMSRSWGDLK